MSLATTTTATATTRRPIPPPPPASSVAVRLVMGPDTTTGRRSTTTTTATNSSSSSILAPRWKNPTHAGRRPSSSSGTVKQTLAFRPWPQKVVVCNGDYRNESWLEHHIGDDCPLYQHQKDLPPLPVPDLPTTLERLVPTAVPLARTTEERDAFVNAVQSFSAQQQQVGPKSLHQRLLDRAANESVQTSWLQQWWNQAGYLQVRDAVTINVSYFFHFQDDPTISTYNKSDTNGIDDNYGKNVKRAASAITALSKFRQAAGTGQLPAEQIGKGSNKKALCSTAYKYMFHATRIPHYQQDTVELYDPSQFNHCIVIRKGHFYAMEFCCPNTGTPYSMKVLQETLQSIVQMAADDSDPDDDLPPPGLRWLGYCTGINRDHWAATRQILLGSDDEIGAGLELLQSGAFVICLDDGEPVNRTEMAQLLLHSTSGYNRFYDKSIQIVVTDNGKCGLVGEHSMMDGMPVVNLANTICTTSYQQSCLKDDDTGHQQRPSSSGSSTDSSSPSPFRRVFSPEVLSRINSLPHVVTAIRNAKDEYDELVSANELTVQSFQGYGSDFMKKSGYSPDAFVQMAMQLATYRLFGGEQVGTYESTQVRPFLHGRTETTRSVSVQSSAFVKRFGLHPLADEHNPVCAEDKIHLFRDAVNAHVKYIGLAAQGQGVDRHLFGMSMLVQDNEPVPDLYNDPVYQRAKRWRVSTSHLTHPKFDGWGYGQVVPDGVGLAYSILPRHCIFNITALKSTGYVHNLSHLLEEALLELRSVIEIHAIQKQQQETNSTSNDQLPTSKL